MAENAVAYVLILVVMEYALRGTYFACRKVANKIRLNPCCNGICSARSCLLFTASKRRVHVLILVVMEYALRASACALTIEWYIRVLILVVMEYALRDYGKKQF